MLTFIPPVLLPGQEEYYDAIQDHQIIFCFGRAGTGKTFIALALGIQYLLDKRQNIERLIIVRPYVASNTGERIGFLPGNVDEKVMPYTEGIKDNLREILHKEQSVIDILKKIEFTTLSFLRGRSLNNAFIIVDEAQNVPINGDAMKMLLTRVAKNSKLIIQGDLAQTDIDSRNSGFIEAINILNDIPEIAIVELNTKVNCRNPLIDKILKAYDEKEMP